MQKAELSKVLVWIYADVQTGRQVLLLKVCPERGSSWQPVTGGVEEGESFEAAALRESIEETGLTFTSKPKSLHFEHAFVGRWGAAREHAFALRADSVGVVTLDPREHVEYRWALLEEAMKLLPFSHQRESLRLLENIV